MAAVAALAVGCGGESGDVLALEVSGGPGGEERRLVITEDGRGRCNGSDLRPLANERLIEARELERELADLPEEERRFADGGGRSYVARLRDGAVHWSERTPAKPELLARLELLALQAGRELCGQ